MNARTALLAAALTLTASRAALADPPAIEDGGEPAAPAPAVSAERTADTGAYLPYTVPARSDAQRAYAWVQGGYDSARGGATIDSAVQANLAGRVSLRAGVGWTGPSGDVRPSVALSVDALRQESHGVNLAIYGGYTGQGFNLVPAATVPAAVSRSFGRLNLLANLGYGYGLEQGEHYGEARVAGLVRVHRLLTVGVDARARLDLERDDDEPTNEPDWDVFAGPVATLTAGRFAVGAGVGYSAVKYRLTPGTTSGMVANLTLGAAF
ncbi:MAG: hypothetical protein R3A52_18130 [Polyangiales bacterium]